MTDKNIINFGAGPAMLPEWVRHRAAEAFLSYKESGIGVAELSHRSPEYEEIHNACINQIRKLLNVPSDFAVLLLQGGATAQFSVIPQNLLEPTEHAIYLQTGAWSEKAIEESKVVCGSEQIRTVLNLHADWTSNPGDWFKRVVEGARYCHVTSNETISGWQCPDSHPIWQAEVPLVNDASSEIMTRQIDWSKHNLVYAGAQKNLGISGVTLVIVRKSACRKDTGNLALVWNYLLQDKNNSLYNTAPTFPITVMKLMLEWIEANGGVDSMKLLASQRSQLIYDVCEKYPHIYKLNISDSTTRSLVNVTFNLVEDSKLKEFLKLAEKNGLVGLKGHRSVGGCRASMYVGMPLEGAEKLANFMVDFAKIN